MKIMVFFSSSSSSELKIFRIEREGESQRYKPFKQLHNRQLLWHGSRTTNFAGILSQGLRIAPPEAPVVGEIASLAAHIPLPRGMRATVRDNLNKGISVWGGPCVF